MNKETKWSAITKDKQSIEDFRSWPTISGCETQDQINAIPKIKTDKNVCFVQKKSREEILENRKQRKAEKSDNQLQDAFKNLQLGQRNQQIKIIDHKLLETYLGAQQKNESSLNDRMRHNKKFRKLHTEAFNFLDFTKPVAAHVVLKKAPTRKVELNIKHKRRQTPKKKLSRLKKNILKIRAIRKIELDKDKSAIDSTIEISVKFEENDDLEQKETKIEDSQRSPEVAKNQPVLRHSRNFRPYCNQFITEDIRTISKAFLTKIFKFQERAYESNPIKAKANCRYKVGIKEVLRLLEAKKVKFLLIAPDLEPNDGAGGIDEQIENMKHLATQQKIPCVFSLKRRLIGYILIKKVPIACVGILSYDGAESEVKDLMKLVELEKINYKNAVKS